MWLTPSVWLLAVNMLVDLYAIGSKRPVSPVNRCQDHESRRDQCVRCKVPEPRPSPGLLMVALVKEARSDPGLDNHSNQV
jgi:hypothetical protein